LEQILLDWETRAIADAAMYPVPTIDRVVKCQNHPYFDSEQFMNILQGRKQNRP
jgi:hypothetical protein